MTAAENPPDINDVVATRDREGPTVSVVVATRNRAALLSKLLAALRAQTRPPDEVLVVDDGSTDETGQVLPAERERGGLPLQSIRLDRSAGQATAREAGWRAARGALIAFTDDDCEPTPAWLEAAVAAYEANPGAFVQGRTEPSPAQASQRGPFSHTISVSELSPAFPTCNMLYLRSFLERVGGFDTDTFGPGTGGEDCDLAWRVIAAGGRPVFAPDALVHHAIVQLDPIAKLRLTGRWRVAMTAYGRHEGLRRAAFTHGIFWKEIHYLLVRALVGLLLPPRWAAVRNWLMYPYLRDIWARGRIYGGGPLLAPYYVLHDLLEIIAVARGGIKNRRLML